MLKRVILGLLVSVWASQAAAAAAAAVVEAPAHSRGAPVAMVAARPRPLHAVLRYDASTTEACRNLSEASSEACLLLALHVIRLSEKPQTRGPLEFVLAPAVGAN
ncbi:MAG TPA: hypothetical protein VHX61_07610 [Rhizomicrobium sp.]|jgi:hypothetical protein|nr:hypothetical protein [Rhizomicrobium sp.]